VAILSGERNSLPPRRRFDRRAGGVAEEPPHEWRRADATEPEVDTAADPDELREFLAADLVGATADPAFKERLRRSLWKWLRVRTRGG